MGYLDPYLIHGSLVPYQHESAAEWQLDWFSHLSRARGCDQQTDTSHMLECKCVNFVQTEQVGVGSTVGRSRPREEAEGWLNVR